MDLPLPPPLERLVESEFIHMIQSAARRHSLRQAGDANPRWAKQIGDVVGGGFTFHIGTECQNDLLSSQITHAVKQGFDT